MASIELLDCLGFIIHLEKSSFMPKQNVTFFGFKINLWDLKMSLTNHKKEVLWISLKQITNNILWIIRLITSSLPGVK